MSHVNIALEGVMQQVTLNHRETICGSYNDVERWKCLQGCEGIVLCMCHTICKNENDAWTLEVSNTPSGAIGFVVIGETS